MTWEETILHIRKLPEYAYLVEKAYYDTHLPTNVERFRAGSEFAATLEKLGLRAPQASRLLDIGAGNGVSSISFALAGYKVTALEPYPSETVGSGAIQKLAEHYQLSDFEVKTDFAEKISYQNDSFDIVYARQSMHHAHNLEKFVAEAARVLKPGGIFMSVRDHVVFDDKDKEWFLKSHPLHHFYGGENAYSPDVYRAAMVRAGLDILEEIRHYENVINYYPQTEDEIKNYRKYELSRRKQHLENKLGLISRLWPIPQLYNLYLYFRGRRITAPDERNVAGRLYSYICRKQ